MKKVLFLLCLFSSFVFSSELTFYDIQAYISSKYNKTVVVDSGIKRNFILYTQNPEVDLTLPNFEYIMKQSGFDYSTDGNFIYITDISKQVEELKQKDIKFEDDLKRKNADLDFEIKRQNKLFEQQLLQKKLSEKKIVSDSFITFKSNLDQETVLSMCKQFNYDCLYISNSEYRIRSKSKIIHKKELVSHKLLTNYALYGEIIEIKKDDFNKHNIDISNLLSVALTSNYLDIRLTAEQGSFFNGLQDRSKVSVSALFQYFKQKGLTKTISQPFLLLTDNKKITFSSGQQLSVKSSESVNTEKGITNYTYKNVSIGIDITALPHYHDNDVFIDLSLDISSLLDYDDEKNLVNISTRSIKGFYRFREGVPVKIVSYNNTFLKTSSHKVPFLSNIPLIKSIFTSNLKDKQNVILFITFTLKRVNNA